MQQLLYPMKFAPILKERIWGGTRLKQALGKNTSIERCGESWELSGVAGNISVLTNGFLQGNSLQKLVETYTNDLVGRKIYERFGNEFPLLIKFIDAHSELSIQVHPDNKLAAERHQACGKTEMWYIMEAGNDSEIITGFNRQMNKHSYLQALGSGRLPEILNREKPAAGDVFFIPAGRIHAIGKNILLAEIQQTSDVTYRIYDWDRTDPAGNPRELHTELAIDAIDYRQHPSYRTHYQKLPQGSVQIAHCPYFTTNLITLAQNTTLNYRNRDSFTIYICTEGSGIIQWGENTSMEIQRGDTILLPAALQTIKLIPSTNIQLLEIYIE